MQKLVADIQVSLAAGASQTFNHGLKDEEGEPLTPDFVIPNRDTAIKVVSADAHTITFNNPATQADSALFHVEHRHSMIMNDKPPFYWQGLGPNVGGGVVYQPADTSALNPATDIGKAVYLDANNHVALTDSLGIATARAKGIWTGIPGQVAVEGPVVAQFTTAGGIPAPGAPAYLAASTDDTNTGAGKLTATSPTLAGLVVFTIGLVDDNTDYAGLKKCLVLIQAPKVDQINPVP